MTEGGEMMNREDMKAKFKKDLNDIMDYIALCDPPETRKVLSSKELVTRYAELVINIEEVMDSHKDDNFKWIE